MAIANTWPYPSTRQPNSRGFYGYGRYGDATDDALAQTDVAINSIAIPSPVTEEAGVTLLDPRAGTLLDPSLLPSVAPVFVPIGLTPPATVAPVATPTTSTHYVVGALAVGAAAWFVFKKKTV